ncbi:MAG: hypothetical protein Q8Q09_11210 [Deltaproteobacteria bacterium]|nr:hypothetical protein [Deltaproteobacteria bacterium]
MSALAIGCSPPVTGSDATADVWQDAVLSDRGMDGEAGACGEFDGAYLAETCEIRRVGTTTQ